MTRQNNQKRYDKSEKGRATKARYRDRFPEYQMIGYAKRRDKKLGLRCDLTREYLRAIWPRVPTVCKPCGLKPGPRQVWTRLFMVSATSKEMLRLFVINVIAANRIEHSNGLSA